MGRIPWKESNLALIGSELDHKIKAAAADGEEQWNDVGLEVGTKVWRIEQFKVVPWPEDKYGSFHKGDSYVVLNTYKKEDEDGNDKLYHDLHIWIGSESSQDEYGTAAYKMVEADDKLGGVAVQHRVVEGKESAKFRSYFDGPLTFLSGGAESGFHHVEPTVDVPHLYKVKGTDRGMSLSQVDLKKSSLNSGDSFVLFANGSSVWLWNGQGANPDEKARAVALAERMCTGATVTVLDQGSGDEDEAAFWEYLGSDGDIQEADEADEEIEEFCPLLFKLPEDPDDEPEQVAKGEEVTYGSPVAKMSRDHLSDSDVMLLDSGWEIFLWLGSQAGTAAKVSAMGKAEGYCKDDPRTADLPLTLVKSGYEPYEFSALFV
jgi:gelsolin